MHVGVNPARSTSATATLAVASPSRMLPSVRVGAFAADSLEAGVPRSTLHETDSMLLLEASRL